MNAALIILAILVVVGATLYMQHKISEAQNPLQEESCDQQIDDEVCCGMHLTCEKDSLLVSIDEEIVYYDDEELDEFKGRSPEEYTSNEIEQFREVLLTLLPQDIAGWARSIQLRGISFPSEIRDELLMIVAEARQKQ